jgi:hypothetical protein
MNGLFDKVSARCSRITTFHEFDKVERSIEADFNEAPQGIKQLPRSSRLGVYVAYVYYLALLKKIRNTPAELVFERRIRIANREKRDYWLIRT